MTVRWGVLAAVAAAVLAVALPLPTANGEEAPPLGPFIWEEAPPLPDPIGGAGPFADAHNDALIVAGGANFPEAPPWEDGEKVWHDRVFVLEDVEGEWIEAGQLPRPTAYGVSITTPDGVVCIGGDDEAAFHDDVFRLRWDGAELHIDDLPPLPHGIAYAAGALVEETIYVAGGLSEPEASAEEALHTFLALDLSADDPGWESLDPWPGPERFLSVAAAQDGAFHLAGGVRLAQDEQGGISREYLEDAYRFTPGEGWERIADLPRPAAGAPSPAPVIGNRHFYVVGGDDGEQAGFEPIDEHPGFPRDILAYHTVTDTWASVGETPFPAVVTVPSVAWGDRVVLPGGETRPGVRTTAVWAGEQRPLEPRFGAMNFATLGLYLGVLVVMAFYFSRYQTGTKEFFLGGRRMPWLAVGISIFGTQLSAITFIAIPAQVYANDWTYFIVNMTIVLVAPVVVFCYLPFYRRLDLTTIYEYLERRFNLGVRLFGSAAFCLLHLGRMGIVLFLPAIVLTTVTGLNLYAAILLMGALATLYTVLGGIRAVIWTDVIQVIVLGGGAILCLFIIAASMPGGFGEIIETGQAEGKFNMFDWTWDATVAGVWVVLIGGFFSNSLIPYSADQVVAQRYLTTSTERNAARTIWTNAVLTIPASLIFFFLGTALYVFYRANPEMAEPGLPGDSVLPLFISQRLPAGIAGIVVAGLFAASMSSLDSSMNSVAASLTTDYRRLRGTAPEQHYFRTARVLTLLLGIFGTGAALIVAALDLEAIWGTYLRVLGLFGGSMAGLFALAVFSKRANGAGALIGAIVSAFAVYVAQAYTPMYHLLYGLVGVASCVVVGYAASLLFPPPAPEDNVKPVFDIHRKT